MAENPSEADLAKLKVSEVKKMLKEHGLRTTGTKNELIERLKNKDTNSKEVTTEPPEVDVLDSSADLTEVAVKDDSAKTTPIAAAPEEKPVTEKKEPKEEKVTKINAQLPAAERLKQRTERFGIVNDDIKKQMRAARFGDAATTKTSTNNTQSNVDVLKKRAERFGKVVSSTLSNVQEEEKIRKRKARFGDIAAPDSVPQKVLINSKLTDEDQKKKRAERNNPQTLEELMDAIHQEIKNISAILKVVLKMVSISRNLNKWLKESDKEKK